MYSEEKLREIQDLAYRYLSKAEIIIVAELDEFAFTDHSSASSIAFIKGRLMRKAEYHSSVIELSRQLSSPAMLIESKIAEQTYLNDLHQ